MNFDQYQNQLLNVYQRLQQDVYSADLVEELINHNETVFSIYTNVPSDTNKDNYSGLEDRKFKLLKLQYYNMQLAYHRDIIKVSEYNKVDRVYKLENFQNHIRSYLSLFMGRKLDYDDFLSIISILEDSCVNGNILLLSDDYMNSVFRIFYQLNSNAYKTATSPFKQELLIEKINKLYDSFLASNTGLNKSLYSQSIKVNIKPISNDFSIKEINFVSDKNKKAFDKQTLTLNNNHVVNLDISEKIYGLSGVLKFELGYQGDHPDFKFLFNDAQLILLDIEITDVFLFLKENNKDPLTRKTNFTAIGNLNDQYKSSRSFTINTDLGINEYDNSLKSFEINFYDPLKALWKLHKPCYVDFNKSIKDIIQDNFFFSEIVEINSSNCKKLENKLPQIFVSTINRDFYDFFIEQLYLNNCVIKYYCADESSKPIYYIADTIDDSFTNPFTNKQEEIKQKLYSHDFNNLKFQKINSLNNSNSVTQNYIIADINYNGEKKKEASGKKIFSNIYETYMQPLDYKNLESYEDNQLETHDWEFELYSNSNLVYVNSELDLSNIDNKIDKDNNLVNIDGLQSLYLVEKKISLSRCSYVSWQIYNNVLATAYKNNSDSDIYEKIVCSEVRNLTHCNNYILSFRDSSKKCATYPVFEKYNSFNIVGKITIAKTVSDDMKKAYKFFKDYQLKETSLGAFQEDDEKGSSLVNNSKDQVLYAINIPAEVLAPECKADPTIFAPVKININSGTNQFMPLRNDDVIIVNIEGVTECNIAELVSNSSISPEEAQKKLLQQQYLGAKENCVVSYSEDDDDENYTVSQDNEKSTNEIILSKKSGFFVTYKAKGEN